MTYLFSLFFLFLASTPLLAKEATPKPAPKFEARIAIREIRDRSASSAGDSCGFYGIWSTPGTAIREILTDELSKKGGITLVEREALSEMYDDEFKQENLDAATVAEKQKFVAANLVVAGTISEFEWCMSGDKEGIDIGGLLGIGELAVKNKSSKAHVAIDLRLIEVKTGKILKTFKSSGQVNDSGFTFSADALGVRYQKSEFEKTPLGKATSMAVADAANQITAAVKALE